MPRVDFRKTNEKATKLTTNVWYRSPLWKDDHLLGASKPFIEEAIAWCGRPLGLAMEMDDEELGGVYVSERKGGKCTQCMTRQKEWENGSLA